MGELHAAPAAPPDVIDTSSPLKRPFRPLRSSLKVIAFAAIIWFFVLPLIPGFRKAAQELREVDPAMLLLGLVLEVLALYA